MAPVQTLATGAIGPLLATAKRRMVPPITHLSTAALQARDGATFLGRRGLTVSDTEKVTLGIIAAYVVVIALLWNLPYVRWVLWPFKVSHCLNTHCLRSPRPPTIYAPMYPRLLNLIGCMLRF